MQLPNKAAETITTIESELDPSYNDVASFVEMADFRGGAPQSVVEPSDFDPELPRMLEAYLVILGLREWRPIASAHFDVGAMCHPRSRNRRRLAKVYMWSVRILIFLLCIYSIISPVILFNIHSNIFEDYKYCLHL